MSDPTMSDPGAWASLLVRRFAAATNLLIAGRTFSIHGEGERELALGALLSSIGAVRVEVGDTTDYLFCLDSFALSSTVLTSTVPTASDSRRLVVIDATIDSTGVRVDESTLVECRRGVYKTPHPRVFLVRPHASGSGRDPVAEARGRIDWALEFMPVTTVVAAEVAGDGVFAGVPIGVSMVLEPKTAVLALQLRDAGATVSVFAHPDEIDDDVASVLRSSGVPVWGRSDEDAAEHRRSALEFLDQGHRLLVDDGSHLIRLAHSDRPRSIDALLGAAEETTSGLRPLRAMADAGVLRTPVIAVNDARSKTLFDNRFGTGQSCVFTILDLLGIDAAGLRVVVIGYGHVGQGVAHHARALGGTVVVAELDPVRALQARFEGHRVQPLLEAVATAELVISATGVRDTISVDVLRACAGDAAIAIAGGVPQEVAIDDAVASGAVRHTVGDRIERFTFADGGAVRILDDGGCINVTAGEGNPIDIMDLSFAVQLVALRYLATHAEGLAPGVHALPRDADDAVASIALRTAGVQIDSQRDRTTADRPTPQWNSNQWKSTRFADGESR